MIIVPMLCILIPLGLAVLWAATATPEGPRPLLPPDADLARIMELGDAVELLTDEARRDVTRGPPEADWFDLDVLLRPDEELDGSYLAMGERPALGADAKDRSADRALLRARASQLAKDLRAAGISATLATKASPPGQNVDPIPVGTDIPMDLFSAREMVRAAASMARLSVAEDDVAEALEWLTAIRAVVESFETQPSRRALSSGAACRRLYHRTVISMVTDARGLATRTDVDTADRLLDGLEAAAAAWSSGPSAARHAEILRFEHEELLRSVTDANGRLLEAEFRLGVGASRMRRIVRNLPGLVGPSRQTLLERAEPALRAFAAQSVPDPIPPGPPVEPRDDLDATDLSALLGELNAQDFLRSQEEDIVRQHAQFLVEVATSRARRRGLRIAIAIERHRLRHGASPRTLDELGLAPAIIRDPWTGTTLEYVPGDPAAGDRWQLTAQGRKMDGSAMRLTLHPDAFDPILSVYTPLP